MGRLVDPAPPDYKWPAWQQILLIVIPAAAILIILLLLRYE